MKKISWNSPVVLSFALVSGLALEANIITNGLANGLFFSVYKSSFTDPLFYVRLFGHVLGHANLEHYTSNMILFLLVGPLLEEKYGSQRFLSIIAIVALVTGLVHIFLPGRSALLGASGVDFALILLASVTGSRTGNAIPLTLIIVAIICAIVLNKTRPGRYMICIGANREAVRLSGVDTRRWEMLAYIISGALAGMAAIFFVGCYTTVQPGRGDTFNNEAIAACVMGGTSMAGGLASILGTVIGAFIIAIMQEGILSMGLNISYQYALTGLIVLGAVIADTLSRRRRN